VSSPKPLAAPRGRNRLALAALIACGAGLLFVIGGRLQGIDYQPLVWALQLELAGRSAYGAEMAARFQEVYKPPLADGGFAYPLPAIWLALPVAALPEAAARGVWFALSFGSVALGMALLRMPWALLLFMPLISGLNELQVSVPLVGMLLIGIWAARERRWRLLAAIVALTVAAKPQTTLFIGGALAIISLRAGQWRPLAVAGAAVAGLSLLLEPLWPLHWLAAAARYRDAIPTMWLVAWTPAALFLLYRRRLWAGLAVLQVCAAPLAPYYYVLLPLLVACVDLPRRRAWLVVACSLASFPLATLGPLWLTLGLFFLLPITAANLWGAGDGARGEP
jgi:hypothetical protein